MPGRMTIKPLESLMLFTEVLNKDLKNDILVFHFIMQDLNEMLLNCSAGQCRVIVTLVPFGSYTFPYASVSVLVTQS